MLRDNRRGGSTHRNRREKPPDPWLTQFRVEQPTSHDQFLAVERRVMPGPRRAGRASQIGSEMVNRVSCLPEGRACRARHCVAGPLTTSGDTTGTPRTPDLPADGDGPGSIDASAQFLRLAGRAAAGCRWLLLLGACRRRRPSVQAAFCGHAVVPQDGQQSHSRTMPLDLVPQLGRRWTGRRVAGRWP